MKIILIYGPPASGKLTIAKELNKITRYRIFHNHLILDLLFSILNRNSKSFWDFSKKIRLEIVNEVIEEKIQGLIITLAYTGLEDDFIRGLIKLAGKKNCSLYLVKLSCSFSALEKRVNNVSRKNFSKITDKKNLSEWFKKYDDKIVFPYKKTLILDTSKTSAKESSQTIIRFCGIKNLKHLEK